MNEYLKSVTAEFKRKSVTLSWDNDRGEWVASFSHPLQRITAEEMMEWSKQIEKMTERAKKWLK